MKSHLPKLSIPKAFSISDYPWESECGAPFKSEHEALFHEEKCRKCQRIVRSRKLGQTTELPTTHPDISKQIRIGTKVEMEHTSDKNKARKIAIDHLHEDPRYYTALGKMEKKLKASQYGGIQEQLIGGKPHYFGWIQGDTRPIPVTQSMTSRKKALQFLLHKYPDLKPALGQSFEIKRKKLPWQKTVDKFVVEDGDIIKKTEVVDVTPIKRPLGRRKTARERFLESWERSRLREIREY